MSGSNKALLIEPPVAKIMLLLNASRLRVRIIERDTTHHNGDIDISRLGEAIAPVRELCGW